MRTTLFALVMLAAVVPGGARGEEAAPTPGPEAPKAAPPIDLRPKPDLTVKPPRELDALLEEKGPLPARDAELEAQVQRRRTLLSVHQAVGLATWGLMATTVVVGQLNYNDLYGGGGATGRYRESHVALAGATTASFAFTGILALAAPDPYRKRVRLDTATVHKVSMAATTLGLASQIALGIATHNASGYSEQRSLARGHQALGYATLGAMTIGAVTLVF